MKGIKNEGITEFYTQRSCRGLRGCGWMLAEEAIAIQNEILPPNPTASARRNYPSDTPISNLASFSVVHIIFAMILNSQSFPSLFCICLINVNCYK
jgi:hypothetical protein